MADPNRKKLTEIAKIVKRIEFSGIYEDCSGSRMGFNDVVGTYSACLVCKGIGPGQSAPRDIPRGHLPGCAIAKVLKLAAVKTEASNG